MNCTTIDWFSEWPADALKSVASRFLQDLEFDTERTRAAVEDMCMVFHQTVRTLAVDFQRSVGARHHRRVHDDLERMWHIRVDIIIDSQYKRMSLSSV